MGLPTITFNDCRRVVNWEDYKDYPQFKFGVEMIILFFDRNFHLLYRDEIDGHDYIVDNCKRITQFMEEGFKHGWADPYQLSCSNGIYVPFFDFSNCHPIKCSKWGYRACHQLQLWTGTYLCFFDHKIHLIYRDIDGYDYLLQDTHAAEGVLSWIIWRTNTIIAMG